MFGEIAGIEGEVTYTCVIYSAGGKLVVKLSDPPQRVVVKRVVKFRDINNESK